MALSNYMGLLSDREQEVIQLIYFYHMSQKEVGEQLAISQMHVSRILRQAIKKLQNAVFKSGRYNK